SATGSSAASARRPSRPCTGRSRSRSSGARPGREIGWRSGATATPAWWPNCLFDGQTDDPLKRGGPPSERVNKTLASQMPRRLLALILTGAALFAPASPTAHRGPPHPDGGLGGDDRTDVYIKQLGLSQIFGYSAPDPGQRARSQSAYLVMDNDYRQSEYPRYSSPLPPMEVTAAHEYNHVLQFNYD